MLTQGDANQLIACLKELIGDSNVIFPQPGEYIELDAKSTNDGDIFVIDVNRKGTLKISKCTYQLRYNKSTQLLRIDLDGPTHTNPDGIEVPCPHIHIYTEQFGLRFAFPLSKEILTDTNDLLQVLIDFLSYINIDNINQFNYQGGGLV